MSTPYPDTRPRALTVSELNHQARHLLESSFMQVWVEGELSGFSRPSSGHWYFSLKDQKCQIRCAMFRGANQRIRTLPREGDQIRIRGKVTLYENRGDFQIIVEHLEPAGLGALQQAFEALKARLQGEGLFDPARKKPIPATPRHIGVVTSPTGAAIHDILTVLKRRCPAIPVTLYPTAVQGQAATADIVQAIDRAQRHGLADVLIIGRGGGSLEDLWCFNEEAVASAIFASRIPVVSAVGHEVDFTIADFVADVRAPTPSAAAELLSPDQGQQLQHLTQLRQRLLQGFYRAHQQRRQSLNHLSQRLRAPERGLQQLAQQTDQLEMRLQRAWQGQQKRRAERLQNLQKNLANQHPERRLKEQRQLLQLMEKQLTTNIRRQLDQARHQLASQTKLLDSLSPLNVLSRGYSITTLSDGSVVNQHQMVATGDTLKHRLQQGWIESVVTASGDDPQN